MLKQVLIFLGGAVLGGGIGYYVGSMLTQQKYMDMVDDAVEEELRKYKEDEASAAESSEESEVSEVSEEPKDEKIELTEVKTSLDSKKFGKASEEKRTQYYTNKPEPDEIVKKYDLEQKLAEEEHPLDDDEEPPIVNVKEKKMELESGIMQDEVNEDRKKHDVPYLITEDSYADEMRAYDKETVFYYIDDGQMILEPDEIIDDPRAIMGDIYDLWNPTEKDESIIVRNPKLAADYYIIAQEGSYDEYTGERAEW